MRSYDDYKAKYDELGTYGAVARFFGVDRKTVKRSIMRGLAREALSQGAQDAIAQTGLDATEAKFGYRKVKDPETGSFNTVFWRAPDITPETFADAIRDALSDIPAADPVELSAQPAEDLMTMIPIADAHIGLMAWGRETGEDWNTRKAAQRLVGWISRALHMLAPSSKCVLLFAGDLLHADDTRSETPQSKHRLDTDTRHFKTLEMTIAAIASAVDVALSRHAEVILRFLPGNHDPHAAIAVMFAMAERYRENDRVKVQVDPKEFFAYQFGKVLVTAHHGHKAKAPQMVHFIADEYAPLWGKTKYRYLFTGHLHHHKSQDIGGMQWEQLPAMTARDVYTSSHAYVARARLNGITYHRDRGEIARVVIGPDE